MTSKAFAPGHITGFFIPSENLLNMEEIGSKGSGFSVKLGVHAEVDVDESGWDIYLDGKLTSLMVVEKAVSALAQGGTIRLKTELPFSQGFGMSGACALSSALAVCKEMDHPKEKALTAAHVAEVFCRTGLGDVIAQSVGGFEVRMKPGLPPHGKIVKKEEERDVVLGITGSQLITPDILSDPSISEWIKLAGEGCMKDFLPKWDFETFCELSRRFATETQFIRGDMDDIFEAVEDHGKGSMSMIGNSVFLVGDTEKLNDILKDMLGPDNVYTTSIDNHGARYM